MTTLEAMQARPDHDVAGAAPDRWHLSVAQRPEDVSHAWLSLEVSGIATPYQTYGWQRAAFAALHPGQSPCIVSLKDRAGRTAAILPFILSRTSGVRIASFPAGKHANYNMGLFRPDVIDSLTPDDLTAALATAAKMAGIDLYALRSQPETWRGHRNPFSALPHRPTAHSAWRADLSGTGDAYIAAIMSSESRKKLRHKERKLADIGPVSYAEAVTPGEAKAALSAFLAQKKARFAAQRVANPFDSGDVLRFLEQAAVQPLADGPPAPLSLFAMMAGDRIIAVFGGIIHAGRFSGMFTSFDPDSSVAKFSPGDLLILNLVRTMCDRGLAEFDLGVGDAAYKTDYCQIEEKLFDSLLPMTMTGRAAAMIMAGEQRLKRFVKNHPGIAGIIRRHKGR